MEKKQRSHIRPIVYVMISVFLIIGYAYLTSNLTINGASLLKKATWDVHFENVQVKDGSVTGEQVTQEPEIDSEQTTVSFHVNLKKPGDYYEFTVDAVNAGTIDAMINTITDFDLTTDQLKYLETSVTYSDGEFLREKQELLSNDYETYIVKVGFKKDLSAEDLPSASGQLDLSFSVEYVQRDDTATVRKTNGYLYNVLKKTSETTGLALVYDDAHNDSLDSSKSTYKIYYYKPSVTGDADTIHNMNNVLFANHCWQMFRTTDTGGVKLIYNGEPQNYSCPDDRPNHFGYTGVSSTSMSGNLYYSSDYTYDDNTKLFTMTGDYVQSVWNDSTYQNLVGKYTCKNSTTNYTCSKLYYVDSYSSGSSAYTMSMSNDMNYSAIGYGPFNKNTTSAAYNGYMFDEDYNYTLGSTWFSGQYKITWQTEVYRNSYYNFDNYYFADSVTYDSSTNKYTLENPEKYSSSNTDNFLGKYTLFSQNENATSGGVFYVTYIDDNTAYYINYQNGNDRDGEILSFYYGDSYISNGDGTYSIENSSLITELEWAENYSAISAKYICVKTGDGICSSVYSLAKTNSVSFLFKILGDNILFSNNFVYSNGKFSLTDDIVTVDYIDTEELMSSYLVANLDIIDTARYTCLNTSGECDSIYYVYATGYSSVYEFDHERRRTLKYMIIDNDNKYDDAFHKMLTKNTTSSNVKNIIDKWYEDNLVEYSSSLDDVIYCNNRTDITGDRHLSLGRHPFLRYKSSITISSTDKGDIYCENEEDRFSISNTKAKLSYPIGLITRFEWTLYGNRTVTLGTNNYWTMTPYYYEDSSTPGKAYNVFVPDNNWFVGSGYLPSGYSVSDSNYIRPVISLNKDVQFAYGDGSLNNPYYIGDVFNINLNNSLFSIPKVSSPGRELTLYSEKNVVTSFKVNGNLVVGDTFIMPNEDIVITDIEYVKANYAINNSDSNIVVPNIGRFKSTIVLEAIGDYAVSSFKVNGILVVGNSFVMPSENVTITDVTLVSKVTVESAHNPYANNISSVVYYENTFEGATSLNVELTYQTEGTSYDWIYIYNIQGSSTPFNSKKYGGSTLKTENITINSNYIKIVFRTDSSGNNYYGFKAVITPMYG